MERLNPLAEGEVHAETLLARPVFPSHAEQCEQDEDSRQFRDGEEVHLRG